MNKKSITLLLWIAWSILSFRTGVSPQVYDSGELTLAAWELGASHQPGQPLHALIGHFICLIPLGSISFRMSLFENGCEILSAYLITRIVIFVYQSNFDEKSKLVNLIANIASVGALVAPSLLRQTCRVEVYGLALLLCLISIENLIRWAEDNHRSVYVAALSAGLCVCVHPPHALIPLLLGGIILLIWQRKYFLRTITLGAISCLSGLLTLVYLPLRAMAQAPMWGDPSTLNGFITYISGKAYAPQLSKSASSRITTLIEVLQEISIETSVLPWLGIVLLIYFLTRTQNRPKRALQAMLIAFVCALAACLLQPFEESNPDNVAYLAPATALLLCTGVIGIVHGFMHMNRNATVMLVLLSGINIFSWPRSIEHTNGDVPALETFAGSFFDAPSPRALVVAETDFIAGAWWMGQVTDGIRPDVAIFFPGLSTSSWHWQSLKRHPAFDGQPKRGVGSTLRNAYTVGAIAYASQSIDAFVEPSWPTAERGSVNNIYLIPVLHQPLSDNVNSFLAAAHACADRTCGDHDVAGAILRQTILKRAMRLAQRGHVNLAMQTLSYSVSRDEYNLLRQWISQNHIPTSAPVPLVLDPNTYLTSSGDIIRFAAVIAHAANDPQTAQSLLFKQYEHGDSYALLQLAWFALASDNQQAAMASLQEFIRINPEQRTMAQPLLERLHHP